MRDGVSSAYHQVKELIAAFRVRIGSHGLSRALEEAVDEFSQRSGLVIALDNRLGDISLTVNEEFHVLQVVREALSNTVRHARATHVSVSLTAAHRVARSWPPCKTTGKDSRNRSPSRSTTACPSCASAPTSLGGELTISAQADAGTRVCLSFIPASRRAAAPGALLIWSPASF